MKLDFTSSGTDVFLNPRMNAEAGKACEAWLLQHTQFSGHIWLASSGTSGKLKFAALSKTGILHSAQAVNFHLSSNCSDRWINVLPTFHVGGIGIFARSSLSGADVLNLYNESFRWNAEHFVKRADDARATLSSLVPTQVFDLVNSGLKAPGSLRAVVVGGGALEESLYRKALSLGWNLLPSYGLTECASQVATAAIGESCRFKILEHIKIKNDSEGYLLIKSPSLLSSYAIFEPGNEYLIDPKVDGWFRTEDRGEIEGPYLRFIGRGTDFLKVSGESVSLTSVKAVLSEWKEKLGVKEEMLLFAVPDDRLGQAVALCVEGAESSKIDQVIEGVNSSVMPFERIKRFYFVEKIPRNELGKPLLTNLK